MSVWTSHAAMKSYFNIKKNWFEILINQSISSGAVKIECGESFGVPKHSELEPNHNLASGDGNPSQSGPLRLLNPSALNPRLGANKLPYLIGTLMNSHLFGFVRTP
jgi:hypothetical protein